MEDTLTKRVRAAAVAGWWTVLIAWCIIVVQWMAYLLIMARQEAGFLYLWGAGFTWAEIRIIWMWGIVVMKLCIGVMLFVVIWLSPWARQLAKVTISAE